MRGHTDTSGGIRIELWIGVYALIATVAIVLPSLYLVEQRVEAALREHELDVLTREERLLVGSIDRELARDPTQSIERLLADAAPVDRSGSVSLVLDSDGDVLAASGDPTRVPPGTSSLDALDPRLADATRRVSSAPPRSDGMRRIETRTHLVLASDVPSAGWLVVTAIPHAKIGGRIATQLATIRVAILTALGLLLLASIVTIGLDRRRRTRAEATLRASEDKLAKAQKLEALGRFAGGIAHDFNNVLTAISGFAQVAQRKGPKDAVQQESLEQIVRACERASELTRQLLAFSRSQPILAQIVDLNVVVRDTHKLLRRLIGADVELVTLPASEPACVLADPGQLEQVLTNLAANARDAMPEGGTLMITLGVSEQVVILRVTDTGAGMSEEVRRRALEPFFTTKPSGIGNGLGLSTCHTIVEQSGGRMEVESRLGAGTTFVLTFPRSHKPATIGAITEVDEAPRARGELVLLVEDDSQVRAVVGQLLRNQGFGVVEAENGAAGLELVRTRGSKIACVITDVIMPILGGGPLVTTIRREVPELPILVMSGYVDDPMLRDDLRSSDVDFLAKPFTAEELLSKVFDAIDRAEEARRIGA